MENKMSVKMFAVMLAIAVIVSFMPWYGASSASNDDPNYLTFTAKEPSTVMLKKNGSDASMSVNLEYSVNSGNWSTYTIEDKVELNEAGDKVEFRGTNDSFSKDDRNYFQFKMTGKVEASGSVTSLIDGDGNDSSKTLEEYCFCGLFSYCTVLTKAPELPSMNLAKGCYTKMFESCAAIKYAPKLPAKVLKTECYKNMFGGCSSLYAPAKVSHITSVGSLSMADMYKGCGNLKVSSTKTGEYNSEWAFPSFTTSVSDWNDAMLNSTGGTFDDNPVLGKKYYYKAIPVDECIIKIESPVINTSKTNKPEPVVKYNGETLVKNQDYTVKYGYYTKSGYAEITGIGRFGGTAKAPFVLLAAPKAKFMAKASVTYTTYKISWNKVTDAKKYKIYFTSCSQDKPKYLGTTTKLSYTIKGLKKGKAYKGYVVAYDKKGKKIKATLTVHAMTKGGSRSNATAITSDSSMRIMFGTSQKITAEITKLDSSKPILYRTHVSAPIRYYSSNRTVATVDSRGNVMGIKEGVAYIYAMAPNGLYSVTTVIVCGISQH